MTEARYAEIDRLYGDECESFTEKEKVSCTQVLEWSN